VVLPWRAPLGTSSSPISVVFGSMLNTTQCTSAPVRGLLSSTTRATDLAPTVPDQRSGGLPRFPLHEYSRGSGPPSRNRGLDTLITSRFLGEAVPRKPQPEANSVTAATAAIAAARATAGLLGDPMPVDATRDVMVS